MNFSDDAVVLLGAGASAEAGIPTTRDATKKLVERVDAAAFANDKPVSALHFVCGALAAYDSAEGKNPFSGLDVERVFAAVELLSERRTLEVSPFVASWHPAVDAWDEADKSFVSYDADIQKALSSSPSSGRITQQLNRLVDSRMNTAHSGATYATLARRMVAELREILRVTRKDVSYLSPLVELGRRQGGLTVATLNYDLSVERAAEANGVELDTGIDSWLTDGHWVWPAAGIRLLKLHGSIDWVWEHIDPEPGELPREAVRVIPDPDEEHEHPALVFGNRGKLRAKGPFLGLLSEFEALLEKAGQLVAIGYSFRDEHVNEAIRAWIGDRRSNELLVVDPHWPDELWALNEFQQDLAFNLTPSESPWAPSFDPRLEVSRLTCSEALTELAGN